MNLRTLLTSLVIGAGVAACGGGASDDESRGTEAARQQIASAVGARDGATARGPAHAASVNPRAAATASESAALATQLFDFAEAKFPHFFPSHRPDMDAPGWRYRHYPETGTYVIVADGRVYVLGGPFGPQVTYVGMAQDLLNPPPNAVAAVTTPATGKTAWNIKTTAQFTLTDTSGLALAGPFTCSSEDAVALEVAADCSTVTGRRLGTHGITVAKGGVVGRASIKVIPQAQPIGTGPYSKFNLVATPDGRALAWGSADAPLGQGEWKSPAVGAFLPVPVKNTTGDGVLGNIVAVAAGEYTAFALTEDGELYSWGNRTALGRPASNGSNLLPGKVLHPTGLAPLTGIVAIAIGGTNAIALADDGTVYTWGDSTAQPGSDPKTFPGAVANLPGRVVGISAGWLWNAVLLADGRVATWGWNSDGATGQGVSSTRQPIGLVLDNVTGQPITGVVAISAGYLHGFALTATGQAYGWGQNTWSTLAQGTRGNTFNKAVLVKAPGGAAPWSGLRMIVAGGIHSLAIDEAGEVYSWGNSGSGQLGDGPNHPRVNESALPAAVLSTTGVGALRGIAAIAAGYEHSLALSADGRLFVWGSGFEGNLGQGGSSSANSHVARAVRNEAGTGTLDLGPMTHWPNLLRRGL